MYTVAYLRQRIDAETAEINRGNVIKRFRAILSRKFGVHMSLSHDWQLAESDFFALTWICPKEKKIIFAARVSFATSRKTLVTATLTAPAHTDVNYKWVISR